MTTAGKPQQKSVSVHQQHLTIYKDDHRNNKEFLKKHPYTVVLDHKAPKKHKKPHEHSSVSKHHPNTKTKKTHPTTRSNSPQHNAPHQPELNTVESDDDFELEQAGIETNEDFSSKEDSDSQGSFLFHEISHEDYDPEIDLLDQRDQVRSPVYAGTTEQPQTNLDPIDNVTVDASSFVLQKDAQDGSVSFKASVIFDFEDNLDDYDIIVTHISG
jgi:hypothetical protein